MVNDCEHACSVGVHLAIFCEEFRLFVSEGGGWEYLSRHFHVEGPGFLLES